MRESEKSLLERCEDIEGQNNTQKVYLHQLKKRVPNFEKGICGIKKKALQLSAWKQLVENFK